MKPEKPQLDLTGKLSRRCEVCGDTINAWSRGGKATRVDAKFCSVACRVADWRRRCRRNAALLATREPDAPSPREWPDAERRAAAPPPDHAAPPERSCIDTSALSKLAITRRDACGSSCAGVETAPNPPTPKPTTARARHRSTKP